MTAITPTCAHAYQSLCLAGRSVVVLHQKFRLSAPNARYPSLHHSRTTTREKGNDFQGWAICTEGGTRSAEGETSAGWGVVARSPHGRLHIMFVPVITTDAPLAFAEARLPTTLLNTRVLLRRFPSLGAMARLPVIHIRVFFYGSKHAASICLGTVQSRANVSLGLTCQRLR